MADARPSINVSVDAAIHDALQETVEQIWKLYGVRVDDVSIKWMDMTTYGDSKAIAVDTLVVQTTTRGSMFR